jgi:hypothetical protein
MSRHSLSRRGFLCFGAASAATAASANPLRLRIGRPVTLTPVPLGLAPGAPWDGTGGSGFQGFPPQDSAWSGAGKPDIHFDFAPKQRVSETVWIGIRGACLPFGIASVDVWVDNADPTNIPTQTLHVDTDVNGKTRRRAGWWFQLDVPTILARRGANNEVHIYARGNPADPSLQPRVIGPLKVYVEATPFSHTVTVSPTGLGDDGLATDYTSIRDALNYLQGVAATAPKVELRRTARYHWVDGNWSRFKGGKGYCVIEPAAGVTTTVGREAMPSFNDSATWPLDPKYDGIELRGERLQLDTRHFTYLNWSQDASAGCNWRLNGIKVFTSAGTPYTYEWNRGFKPSGLCLPAAAGYFAEGGLCIEDCYIENGAASLTNLQINRGNLCKSQIERAFNGSRFTAECHLDTTDITFYRQDIPVGTIVYSGSKGTNSLTLLAKSVGTRSYGLARVGANITVNGYFHGATARKAEATLYLSAQPAAGNTVTLSATSPTVSEVFTFVSGTPANANEVQIGADRAATIANLNAAINAVSTIMDSSIGSATITKAGNNDTTGPFTLYVDYQQVATFTLGAKPSDTYYLPSAIMDGINASLGASGWTATLTGSDYDTRRSTYLNGQGFGGVNGFTHASVGTAAVNLCTFADIHVGGFNLYGPSLYPEGFVLMNSSIRDNVDATGYQVILVDDVAEVRGGSILNMVWDGGNIRIKSTGPLRSVKWGHITLNGSIRLEVRPESPTWDIDEATGFWNSVVYSATSNQVSESAGNTMPTTEIGFTDSFNVSTPTAAMPGTGNMVALPSASIFTDLAGNDFGPAAGGALVQADKLRAPVYGWDMFGNPRAALDAVGAIAAGYSAAWPTMPSIVNVG